MLNRIIPFLLALLTCQACAHQSRTTPTFLSEINVLTEAGESLNLGYALGKVTVLDICAAWNNACLHNARMLSKACAQLCGDDVEMMSILLDDLHDAAMNSYREVLSVRQKVYIPAEDFRTGETSLGALNDIPRLVIFDRDGRLIKDIRGAVISGDGLIDQLKKLL
jgi:hypothetical protein